MRQHRIWRWLRAGGVALVVSAVPLQGCKDLLEITDPDIILEANSPGAALAIANGAIVRLTQAMSGIEGADNLFMFGGLVADEWRSGDTFVQRNNQDQRIFQPENTFNDNLYLAVNRPRVQAEAAIRALRRFLPDSTRLIGVMFAVQAYVETIIGEHYCNGAPLSTIDASIVSGRDIPIEQRAVVGDEDTVVGPPDGQAERITKAIGPYGVVASKGISVWDRPIGI